MTCGPSPFFLSTRQPQILVGRSSLLDDRSAKRSAQRGLPREANTPGTRGSARLQTREGSGGPCGTCQLLPHAEKWARRETPLRLSTKISDRANVRFRPKADTNSLPIFDWIRPLG